MQNTFVGMAQLAVNIGNTDIWLKYQQTKWDDGWGNSVRISPLTTTTNNPCAPSAASGNACASLVNTGSLGPSALYNTGTGYFRPAPGAALIPIPMAPANPAYTTPNPGVTNHRQVNHDTPGHEVLDPSRQFVLEVASHFDSFDVKYLGGYYDFVYTLRTDFDNTNRLLLPVHTDHRRGRRCRYLHAGRPALYRRQELLQQRVNIASTTDSPLQWIFGLYQFHEEYEQPLAIGPRSQAQYLTPVYSPGPPAIAAPPNPYGANYYTDAAIETNSKAVYGQIDWSLTDKWTLTLGLRYTEDEKFGDEFSRLIFWDPGTFGSFTPAVDITPGQLGSRSTPVGNGFYTRHLANDWSATTGTAGDFLEADRQHDDVSQVHAGLQGWRDESRRDRRVPVYGSGVRECVRDWLETDLGSFSGERLGVLSTTLRIRRFR